MADHHQRVRPVVRPDSPTRPVTSPLLPPGSAASENGSPPNGPALAPWNLPLAHPEPPKNRRSSCCRCLCWSLCLLVLLAVAIVMAAGILYIVFQPKLPKYSIDSLHIVSVRLINTDMNLYAKFRVKITARNPNEKIGIYYEHGGQLSVWYNGEKLCKGSIPSFYQGHRNVTVLNIDLTGRTKSGSTLMKALQEQQNTRRIPLDLKVQAPIAVKVGKLKLMEVRILGECLLMVDSLSSSNSISIRASNCRYRLKL